MNLTRKYTTLSVLAALLVAMLLLTGCGPKEAPQAEKGGTYYNGPMDRGKTSTTGGKEPN